jgi:hypothetical protein
MVSEGGFFLRASVVGTILSCFGKHDFEAESLAF